MKKRKREKKEKQRTKKKMCFVRREQHNVEERKGEGKNSTHNLLLSPLQFKLNQKKTKKSSFGKIWLYINGLKIFFK